MKLPIIWKHVLNDSSKAVEIFVSRMAEVTVTTEFDFFRARMSRSAEENDE